METRPNGRSVPVGSDFLKLVWDQENECAAETDKWLSNAGVKAPKTLEALGTVLSLLDRLASCWWSCRGGDHVEEYLIVRAVNNARAALRLLRLGFYDEALSTIRSMGENANLLSLFASSQKFQEDWRTADDTKRKQEFSPMKVRQKLDELGAPIPMDREIYHQLSERFAHVTSHTKPQAHNPFEMPLAGGFFQEAGVLVTLNELGWMAAWIAACGALLIQPCHKKDVFIAAITELEESIGSINLKRIDDYWEQVRKFPAFRELESRLKAQQAATRKSLREQLN